MHAIVSACDFLKGTAAQKAEQTTIKEVITKEDYVTMLEKSLAICKPIDLLTVKYQSDSIAVSEVLQDFNKQAFHEILFPAAQWSCQHC